MTIPSFSKHSELFKTIIPDGKLHRININVNDLFYAYFKHLLMTTKINSSDLIDIIMFNGLSNDQLPSILEAKIIENKAKRKLL